MRFVFCLAFVALIGLANPVSAQQLAEETKLYLMTSGDTVFWGGKGHRGKYGGPWGGRVTSVPTPPDMP